MGPPPVERPLTATGPGAPALALVHGFTLTGHSFLPLLAHLSTLADLPGTARLPDLPGHGASGGTRVSGLSEAAELLGCSVGRAHYLGYSMGSRVVLRLALDRPDLVVSMVLVGVGPGIEDAALARERRLADEALAARIERDGVASFVDAWLQRPMFSSLSEEASARQDRLSNTAAGLAHALRVLGPGACDPMWEELSRIEVPVLLLAGEADSKFAGLGARAAAAIGKNAAFAPVPGAGHAAHLERPAAVAALLGRHLKVLRGV
ncbi:MAG: alpha/beta fold hydrolase [Acidimicrobiales bacterium]